MNFTTCALYSIHCHFLVKWVATDDSLPITVCGEIAVSTGANGLGKLMSACTPRVSIVLIVGSTEAVGALAVLIGKCGCNACLKLVNCK